MAIWVNIVDRRPGIGQTVLVEMTGGDFMKKEYTGLEGWWIRNILRWLDEEIPSFTTEQVMKAYDDGWSRGYNHNYDEACKYMMQEYSIKV